MRDLRSFRACSAGLFLLLVLFLPRAAEAYIDPGLAGKLFQLGYLLFYGSLLFVVTPLLFFWSKITRFLRTALRGGTLRSSADPESEKS